MKPKPPPPPPAREALPAEPFLPELVREPFAPELIREGPLPRQAAEQGPEFLDPSLVEFVPPEPWYSGGPLVALWRLALGIASLVEWLFGAAVMTIALAVVSCLPLLQFLALGYLLEAGGRVARTGQLSEGFIGARLAARLGVVFVACYLMLLPVRVVSGLATAAAIIDPDGPSARAWRVGLLVLIALAYVHLAAAIARGGRWYYFLWPFNVIWLVRRIMRGGYYTEARDAVWETVASMRLPYYFWMGLRGFVVGLAWLAVPVTLLVAGHAPLPIAPLFGWLGAFLLAVVVLYLPFLQLRMAAEDNFWAGFHVSAVRADFLKAPFLFTLALFLTLLTALPLYLLRIETVPAEVAWLPGLAFILFIFPSRLMAGWALGRAKTSEEPRHWLLRAAAWLPMLPVALFYVLVVYFTQFTSWNGLASLYEQHAFLLPVPSLRM